MFFVIVDTCNENSDFKIADYIVKLHKSMDEAIFAPYSGDQLKRYIRFAKNFKPRFTKEAADMLRFSYLKLRQGD